MLSIGESFILLELSSLLSSLRQELYLSIIKAVKLRTIVEKLLNRLGFGGLRSAAFVPELSNKKQPRVRFQVGIGQGNQLRPLAIRCRRDVGPVFVLDNRFNFKRPRRPRVTERGQQSRNKAKLK